MNRALVLIISSIILIFNSCSSTESSKKDSLKKENNSISTTIIPEFNADSALLYIKKQCDFGPRVPNSIAHKQCAKYLVSELTRFGAEVIEQDAELKAYNGTILESKNIIGVFNPEKTRRVILFAH